MIGSCSDDWHWRHCVAVFSLVLAADIFLEPVGFATSQTAATTGGAMAVGGRIHAAIRRSSLFPGKSICAGFLVTSDKNSSLM